MLQVPSHFKFSREIKTSEPRFKRLNISNDNKVERKGSTQHHFRNVNRGNALDNSKENLSYEHYLSKIRSACKLDENTIVSRYLNTIRKDYDQMNKISQKELITMKMKKKQIQFLKVKNHTFLEKRKNLEEIIYKMEQQKQQIQQKYENAKMQTKTLENIISRMRKDQIFYKQYGRIKDQKLKQILKSVKAKEETLIHEQENIYKLLTVLNQCKQIYNKNSETREKKFGDYCGKISDVKQRNKFIQQRKERTYELQSIELNDTLDEKNIHMREIALANRVADSLLESKVNSLIKKYADVQSAFHLVKVKTGISEPTLLTTKFFSYEETAQSLLESINILEKKTQDLINKKAKLNEIYKQLVNEGLSEVSIKLNSHELHLNQQKYNLVKIYNDKHLLKNRIQSWIQRKNILFNGQTQNSKRLITEKFKAFCQQILKASKQYENVNIYDKKIQGMGIRIKKIVREPTSQDLNIKIKQIDEMNDSNLIEDEFIKTSRQNVQKKNFTIKQKAKRDSNSILNK